MSQDQMILWHLKQGKPITPIEALNLYGCFRLGARIHDLKRAGHCIVSRLVESGGKRFAEYRILGV